MFVRISQSINQTQAIGNEFSKILLPGSTVALFGELGSGKTQFIKGICLGLGVEEIVNSPTFIIVNEYSSQKIGKIFHFDLFRIKTLQEVIDLGFDDYVSANGIILIEWPELIENILPANVNKIYISHINEHENMRQIKILC